MTTPQIDLKACINWNHKLSNSVQNSLYTIFDNVINGSAPTALLAESTAGEIAKLYEDSTSDSEAQEQQDQNNKNADDEDVGRKDNGTENFLWVLFTEFIAVAKEIPTTDPRQPLLVDILEALKKKESKNVTLWEEEWKMWSGLPMFGPCMREAWNIAPHFDGSEEDKRAIKHWISLNAFTARVFSSGIKEFSNFAIWGLRSALEEESATKKSLETHIWVACEWVCLAGKKIYDLCEKNEKLDESSARVLKPGKLHEDGKSGFNKQRWSFWKKQLEELRVEASPEAKERLDRVVILMGDHEG